MRLRTWALAVAAFAAWPCAVGADLSFDHMHARYDRLLRDYVQDGRVNYRAMHARPADLREYVAAIGRVDAATLARFSREQQIAYWLNAYNAFTLEAIVDHYPLKRRGIKGLAFPANSIWQIPGVWKELRRRAGGRDLSLDDIEHGILRPQYGEPRVHFALVCASISCPDLRAEAYRADRLDQQLEEQARRFIGDAAKGARIDHEARAIHLSPIFNWFGEDFVRTAGQIPAFARFGTVQSGVLAFVLRYRSDARDRAVLSSGEFDLGYLNYDWSLNEG